MYSVYYTLKQLTHLTAGPKAGSRITPDEQLNSVFLYAQVHKIASSSHSNERAVKVGFPIQKYADQRVLAPPRILSQLATSFFASLRQGIRQKPFNA
jgi:hypothetical protein